MQTYDFIVVGSGSAGSVVAERLSASGRFSVLVLEAGGTDRRFYVQMPLGYGKTFFDPAVNWNYRTEPDPGLAGNADHWPRGKILGGSSSINAMVWIRGQREDYDAWAAAGNPGWGFDDLLPAFKAIEDNEAGADEWRGVGGPLHVTDCRAAVHPLTQRYLKAGRAGRPAAQPGFQRREPGRRRRLPDHDQGRPPHVGRARLPAPGDEAQERPRRDERAGDEDPVRGQPRRRRRIRAATAAPRPSAPAAKSSSAAARSTRRNFCSSPASARPPLLQGLGIPVVHANDNVGANLQDHVGINYTFKGRVPTLNQILRPWWGKLLVGMQYLLLRSGPLSLSMNNAGGFFRTDPALPRPNMQLYFQAFSTVIPKSGERPILTPDPWPGFSIGLSNCRPSSRGEIMIRSTNPRDYPEIVANAYSTEADVAEMLAAVKFVRKIAAQPAHGRDHRGRGSARSVDHFRRGPDPGFPQTLRHRLSPGLDLPHGAGPGARGRRSAPARPRACGPARHRRLDLSRQHFRQHQRRRRS